MPNLSVGEGFYLLHKQLASDAPPTVVEVPTDHLVVIDCSGSMTGELPQIRQQLKNKLPMLLRENDTITIVWFSGRSQFGIVVEAVPLRTAIDLAGVHRAIDNFLRPIGLTGFVEPLREAAKVIGRLRKPGRAVNLFFMSDGYDNQWKKDEILHETALLQDMVSSAAVVEYGYYCNKPLMVQMAERLGATEVLAENFSQYEPIFESAMTKKVLGAKKVKVRLDTNALHGFAFSHDGGEVVCYAVDGRSVMVPEGTRDIYWFAELPSSANFHARSEVMETKTRDSESFQAALYAGLVPLTQRMLSNEIFKILKVLGDVRLIRQFAGCFGKQSYTEFQAAVTEAAFDPQRRHIDGYNPDEVPAEDAYTILDLLYELSSDDGNLFYPTHESFDYQRTGRKAVQADRVLTEDEGVRVGEIAAQLAATRDPAVVQKLQEELSALVEQKGEGLQFVPDDPFAGYPVSSLVFNEDRPNISAQVRIPGKVYLGDLLWDEKTSKVPINFPTQIFRNYTIVRDGIRNVKVLPVSLTEKTHAALTQAGVMKDGYHPDVIYELDLASLPLINRQMVKSVSAREMFVRQFEMLKLKAAQKVFNYFYNEKFPPVATKGIADKYGADAAAWLAELGIKDYGFSPKVQLAEATESYYGKELKVAISGLSSVPAVKEVLTKLDSGKKLTPRENLLVQPIQEYRELVNSAAYNAATDYYKEEMLKVWLTGRKTATTAAVRQTMRELSEIKFSIIIGQVWVFPSLDENSMTLELDGNPYTCTANLNEVEIKI